MISAINYFLYLQMPVRAKIRSTGEDSIFNKISTFKITFWSPQFNETWNFCLLRVGGFFSFSDLGIFFKKVIKNFLIATVNQIASKKYHTQMPWFIDNGTIQKALQMASNRNLRGLKDCKLDLFLSPRFDFSSLALLHCGLQMALCGSRGSHPLWTRASWYPRLASRHLVLHPDWTSLVWHPSHYNGPGNWLKCYQILPLILGTNRGKPYG